MVSFSEAAAFKRRIARSVLKQSNVQAIGVGYRDPKHPEKGAAVLIYVDSFSPAAKKLPSKRASRASRVPIRILKAAKLRANSFSNRRIRPVRAGYSVGTTHVSGTLGLIVADRHDPARRYILSNNHILTNPLNGTTRTATLQPGGQDRGRLPRDRVGTLDRVSLLRRRHPNYIDAALSIPIRNSIVNPRYPIAGTVPGHVTTYRVGDRFMKVGQSSGFRHGFVESVDTDVLVEYDRPLGILRFENQTMIRGDRPVSLPGDSGSVWLRRKDNYAAAVNFAGSDDGKVSVAFPVDWAMQAFRTLAARPNGAGRVRKVVRKSPAYAPRLTKKQLMSIQVVQAISKGAK